MSLSQNQKIAETFVKPALAGAIAGVTSMYVFGFNSGDTINLLGMVEIPASLGVGLAAAGGTALGTVGKDWVLPYINKSSRLAESEGMILIPLLSGAATTALLHKNLDGSGASYLKSFAIGGGSAIAADYVQRTFLTNFIK